jgi:uncharacterized protein YqjF (DUF2071 family)
MGALVRATEGLRVPASRGGRLAAGEQEDPTFRPLMYQRWERVAFLHWAYHPRALQRVLQPGLEVETFEGAGWVSLVGCVLRVAIHARRSAPRYVSTSRLLELRTYVRGPGGLPGVWALALEGSSLAPVCAGRAVYRLPYSWARTEVSCLGDLVTYASRRRWPGSPSCSATAIVDPGELLLTGDLTELDRFLTARFAMWLPGRDRSYQRLELRHAPWALRRARVLYLEETLTRGVGLLPAGNPLVVHFADGMTARVGSRIGGDYVRSSSMPS